MSLDGGQFKGTNGCSQWFLSRLEWEKPTARRVVLVQWASKHFDVVKTILDAIDRFPIYLV